MTHNFVIRQFGAKAATADMIMAADESTTHEALREEIAEATVDKKVGQSIISFVRCLCCDNLSDGNIF